MIKWKNKNKVMTKVVVLFFIAVICSCSNDTDNTGTVNIRLSNISGNDFNNITVSARAETVQYGDLSSGQLSNYKVFETAYRYAYIELYIDGEIFILQPTDYVGEVPLSRGNYTYEINASPQNNSNRLSLSLVRD